MDGFSTDSLHSLVYKFILVQIAKIRQSNNTIQSTNNSQAKYTLLVTYKLSNV